MLNLSIVLPDNRILLSKNINSRLGWEMTNSRYINNFTTSIEHIDSILLGYGLDKTTRKKLNVRIIRLENEISVDKYGESTKIDPFIAKITKSGTLSYGPYMLTRIHNIKTLYQKLNKNLAAVLEIEGDLYSSVAIEVLKYLQNDEANIWD